MFFDISQYVLFSFVFLIFTKLFFYTYKVIIYVKHRKNKQDKQL